MWVCCTWALYSSGIEGIPRAVWKRFDAASGAYMDSEQTCG